jgi:dipeptidyl-peptidase-4
VTDYRNYDSIYTERYMDLPKNNPEGYRKSAPRHRAEKLSGKLLLIHGGFDDNVHPQSTSQFAYDLQKAGRPFRLMLYPRMRHSFTDAEQIQHLRSMLLAFVEETLLGAPAHAWPLDQAPEVTSSGGSGSRRR